MHVRDGGIGMDDRRPDTAGSDIDDEDAHGR